MSKNVLEAYNNMILNSVECKELKENLHYQNLLSQHIDIWRKIKNILPEEGKELLLQLDEIEGSIREIEQITLYKNGLHDAVGVLKLLNVI